MRTVCSGCTGTCRLKETTIYKKTFKVYFTLFLVVLSVTLVDQITKSYVARSFKLYDSMVVIQHFFNLTYTRNPGAAFGFLASRDGHFRTVFFLLISCIALIFLIYFFIKTPAKDHLSLLAISFILGGAVGNFLDRIQTGEVIDFLDFYIGQHHWWIFNVADSAITMGITILVLQMLFKKPKESEVVS